MILVLKIVGTIALAMVAMIQILHQMVDTNFQAPIWQHAIFNMVPWVLILLAIWVR